MCCMQQSQVQQPLALDYMLCCDTAEITVHANDMRVLVACPLLLQVNLRHLLESVALLAARLRQHKSDVALPAEIQGLTPQVGLAVLSRDT